MTMGQPQKVASKLRHRPNIKTPSCVCFTEGCGAYLNEFDRHLKCVSYLSPRHFMEPHMGNPCSPCQSLSSSYRSIQKGRTRPQVAQSGEGAPTQSHLNSIVGSVTSEPGGSRSGSPSRSGSRDGPTTPSHPGVREGDGPTDLMDLPLPPDWDGSVHPPTHSEEGGGTQSVVIPQDTFPLGASATSLKEEPRDPLPMHLPYKRR